MFNKMIVLALIIAATTLTLPQKAEAAYPNGSSAGVALTGGFPFGGIMATAKFAPVPLMFGLSFTGASVDLGFGRTSFLGIHLTGDWWALKLPLGQAGNAEVSMYLGPGAVIDLGFDFGHTSYFYTDLGIRMPVGFSFLLKQTWEIFIEPSIGLNIIGIAVDDGKASLRLLGSSLESFSFGLNSIRLGGQFGFRYWF